MITPELLMAGRNVAQADDEVLLLIRAERELVETELAERRHWLLERRVLFTMSIIFLTVALVCVALGRYDGTAFAIASLVLNVRRNPRQG